MLERIVIPGKWLRALSTEYCHYVLERIVITGKWLRALSTEYCHYVLERLVVVVVVVAGQTIWPISSN